MLNVFLSGGMSGLSHEEMTGWRNIAKLALDYWGAKVISPPDYFVMNGEASNEKEAFIFDTHCVKKCDVLIVNMNKPDSIGTAQEVMLAYEYKKPIVMIARKDKWDSIHPWYKIEATSVFFYEDYEDETALFEEVANYVMIYE